MGYEPLVTVSPRVPGPGPPEGAFAPRVGWGLCPRVGWRRSREGQRRSEKVGEGQRKSPSCSREGQRRSREGQRRSENTLTCGFPGFPGPLGRVSSQKVRRRSEKVGEGFPSRPLLGPLLGRCLPICTDFSDFLGRLHARQTRLQEPRNALGVEESSSPRRVLHF